MKTKPLPIFSVVGTTSVGKSDAAFKIAEYVTTHKLAEGVDIISADSRQVYAGLEILTGADIPAVFQAKTNQFSSLNKYFLNEKLRIFGLSLVKVSDEFSVGAFQKYAHQVIAQSQNEKRLVLLVGGTGLYHEHLWTTDPQFSVLPDPAVRDKAARLSIEELQKWLQAVSFSRFSQMNESDQHNPRRLIRAIEIAVARPPKENHPETKTAESVTKMEHIFLGLQLTLEEMLEKITARVQKRFAGGAVEEVQALLASGISISTQAATTLGFSQIKAYLSGEITKEECLELWIQADFSYSKRQITWWKKRHGITWFDASDSDWSEKLLKTFANKI